MFLGYWLEAGVVEEPRPGEFRLTEYGRTLGAVDVEAMLEAALWAASSRPASSRTICCSRRSSVLRRSAPWRIPGGIRLASNVLRFRESEVERWLAGLETGQDLRGVVSNR